MSAAASTAPNWHAPKENASSYRATLGANFRNGALDYQENGKDRGPILVELMPCLKVDLAKGSPTIYNCLEPISGPIKKNSTVNAWMVWFCPKGGVYDDLTVQFLYECQVRQTLDLKVEGLSRTRTFRSHTFGKSGKWQIKVARGDKELATANVTVE